MSNTENKTKDKRIKTGSIALRIALGSALYLLLAFLVVDIAVMLVEAWPQIDTAGQPLDVFTSGLSACGEVLTSRRFDVVLQIEGVIILIRLILTPFDVKSRVGMRKMTQLQPKMQELQKKYAK
ncbi:MAG: YidC/Oxa1 family membrane protein insertase, partial [Firmicutes bacterium]|nr:YidC/Oxa1 family membrane protein insertase [Bacillota bacterium]